MSRAEYFRLRKEACMRLGLCRWCEKRKREPGRSLCARCAKMNRKNAARHRAAGKEGSDG